ncbi:MAG: NeuD/PglB/VioB family sugar acetyltransferase [Mediterranea sp.]|jgi:sugar O-acyltransferase (sialic acid O-acetyltransferase NeuD family)|nr:NeuD/PglB/VioB family sugar acetyltransferase [Mediterranea sp.]
MQDIAIYGAGGLGREVACLLRIINKETPIWNFVGFYDDGKEAGSRNEYGEILGGINELNAITKPLAVAIAIGSPRTVKQIVEKITSPLVEFPNIIAPDTVFLDKENITMGRGNIICSGCVLSCNVHIGNFNLFDWAITVGHDTVIGNFNSLMPGVRVSGEVNVENANFFGASSFILQQLTIGNNTVIGANSTVVRATMDGKTYVGSPATVIKY